MKKMVAVLICAWLVASCMATNQQKNSKTDVQRFYEATPSTEVDRSRLQDVCPDFSGVYKSSALKFDTTYVTQTGCESIYISVEHPNIIQRNTYNLDGTSVTVKKFYMDSIPYTASFINNALWLSGRGRGFIQYTVWKFDEANAISEVIYFERDGQISKFVESSYYRVEE